MCCVGVRAPLAPPGRLQTTNRTCVNRGHHYLSLDSKWRLPFHVNACSATASWSSETTDATHAPQGVFVPGGGRMSMHQLHAEINKWWVIAICLEEGVGRRGGGRLGGRAACRGQQVESRLHLPA